MKYVYAITPRLIGERMYYRIETYRKRESFWDRFGLSHSAPPQSHGLFNSEEEAVKMVEILKKPPKIIE